MKTLSRYIFRKAIATISTLNINSKKNLTNFTQQKYEKKEGLFEQFLENNQRHLCKQVFLIRHVWYLYRRKLDFRVYIAMFEHNRPVNGKWSLRVIIKMPDNAKLSVRKTSNRKVAVNRCQMYLLIQNSLTGF